MTEEKITSDPYEILFSCQIELADTERRQVAGFHENIFQAFWSHKTELFSSPRISAES
jgi:hypothetical protein